MQILLLALILLFASASPANAVVTIRNFWTDASLNKNKVVKLDSQGHGLDAHDGQIIQDVNDTTWFYRIGRSVDCGDKWMWGTTPFCGFKSYKTKDFKVWYDNGLMFTVAGTGWQARCKTDAATYDGCFRPHVIYHSGSAKWKLWVNVSAAAPRYVILESTALAGPYTEVGTVDLGAVGDFGLFKDDNGDGYIAFTDAGAGFDIKLSKLNSSYTDVTGSIIIVKSGAGAPDYEAPAMFKHGSVYHIAYGITCAFCANSDTSIVSNTGNPISGTWTQGATLNTTSCGGQLGGIQKINVNGSDVWHLWTDLWKTADPNDTTRLFGFRIQGQAAYFETVLTFTGDTPDAYTCSDTYTLALSPDMTDNTQPGIQFSSVADNYTSFCDIRASTFRYQKFIVTGTINKLRILLFKGPINGGVCDENVCPDITSDLRVTIFVDNANAPNTTVQTIDLAANTIGFSPRMYDVNLSALGAGTYGFSLRPATTYTGNGAYCFGYNDNGSNYSGGAEAVTFDGGSSWTTEFGGIRDLMFQGIGTPLRTIRIEGGAVMTLDAGTTFKVY